jgi:carbamoyl-phosphate synthase large subunit
MSLHSSSSLKNPPSFPKRVLVLGSGALKIGQAGEFDYSGTQALKALKEEGIYTVLVNPNIATIQTSHDFADNVYFLPITPHFIEKVIAAEEVDAILLSFGGQTALNCGLELEKSGVLHRYGVRVLGTPVSTIEATEDRQLFVDKLEEIGVMTARSRAVRNPEEAIRAANEIGFPVMLRAAFALGGKGSGIARDEEECFNLASRALVGVPQVLVEEYLGGWKEIEYEVVRDSYDNCVTVCNMENVDPMGVHTGESIVVAPSQTLNDEEYQGLRDISLEVIRHLGIVGECNIQFALHPQTWDYRVIEVNARLSRSSALASKATGYPLAYIAAKLALGYRLPDLKNAITKTTTAFFEPALDYIVCKIPRWDLQKFEGVEQRIGSEMKSVGEVMAIGRSFPEALQKALRMLEIGVDGLDHDAFSFHDLEAAIETPSPKRIFAVASGLAEGMSVDEISRLTAIDPFFVSEIARLIESGQKLSAGYSDQKLFTSLADRIRDAKRAGYSDRSIAKRLNCTEAEARELRHLYGISPQLAQIDTLAAEYPAETNYLYLTYGADSEDVLASPRKKILVLGSGCYRIGSSVEFDWCAVNTVLEARALGYETLLLNCNPETVSTDYDICDRLIFDEITIESILEICATERPEAVVVSMGGQTPNNLAIKLHRAGIKVLGTLPESIDRAESRDKFSALLDALGIDQPRWAEAKELDDLDQVVKSLGGYPLLVRPSYVLSGAAMRVIHSADKLRHYIENATRLSPEHPVVISKFETDAMEIELDAVARQGEVILWAVSEHIERAGVHSGDATLVFPAQDLSAAAQMRIREIGEKLARALQITGPFNLQMLVKGEELKVIECNLRASRSFPFVSKVLGINFIREAIRAMLGVEPASEWNRTQFGLDYVAVKAPQFSFDRLKGAEPKLGVEMASTGEVACFGATREEALLKAMMAVGLNLPSKGALLALDSAVQSTSFAEEVRLLKELGLELFATPRTAESLRSLGFVLSVREEDGTAHQILRSGRVDIVFSDSGVATASDGRSSHSLQRLAIDLGIPVIGEAVLSRRLIQSLASTPLESLEVKPWKQYLRQFARESRISLFIRQPLTETSEREAVIIQGVLDVLHRIDGTPYEFQFLTGHQAQNSRTFRRLFEKETGQQFTPENFRRGRLELIDQADAIIVIRTGLSESTAFEVAYNIFGGPRVPMFFAIWDRAPIKTTLLQDLNEIVPVRYITFSDPEELSEPLLDFFGTCVKANCKEHRRHSRQTLDHSFPMHSSMPRPAPA